MRERHLYYCYDCDAFFYLVYEEETYVGEIYEGSPLVMCRRCLGYDTEPMSIEDLIVATPSGVEKGYKEDPYFAVKYYENEEDENGFD